MTVGPAYLASLTSYKHLLDTQSTLQATVDNVNAIGGSDKIRQAVLDTLLPIMQKMESTIDKIGDDFSVQKFDPAEYVLFSWVSLEGRGADRAALLFWFSSRSWP